MIKLCQNLVDLLYLQRRIISDKGHLSNELCAGYLSRLIGPNTKKVVLAHLSESNNTKELALSTNKKVLEENDIIFDTLECADQNILTEVSI